MSIKEFKFIKQLGKGAFGKVDLVQRREDGQIYAMKIVKISQLNTKEQENALNEVRVLASISHPNIIGYKEAFFDSESQSLNIVMEYAEDGDLESKIKNHMKNKTHFPENEIWSYLIQMIEGLKALHDIKTMHRDLKSANVFLMKNGQVKLGDLNVSKVVKMGMVQTQTGTPYYASPEVWADKPYDYKSDIWSVGCVLYELCALKPPFRGNNIQQLYASVSKGIFNKFLSITLGVYEPIPNIYSNDLHRILAIFLQTNPFNRPNCDMLLSNPIFLKRMDYTKTFGYGGSNQLLNTIKLPKNFNEINQKLPKTKKYLE